MQEWLSYSLSDFLLFSPETYRRLFGLYNAALWPAQLAALAAGVGLAALLLRGRGRAAALLLAAAWAWVAWGFFLQRYATINWAAPWAAVGFALQALLLVLAAAAGLPLRRPGDPRRAAGLGLLGLALLWPLLSPLLGRPWAQAELFGLAPDPTALACLGLLLCTSGRLRWLLLPLPLAWCLVTGATLWAMDAPEAFAPPLLALLALLAMAGGRR